MRQCPDCRAENAPDAHFCAECGARLNEPPPAPQDQPAAPTHASEGAARPTGRETIVLRAFETPPTERLPDPSASTPRPYTDATIIAAPPGPGTPTPSSRTPAMPTAALPALLPGGYASGAPTQPPPPTISRPAKSGGGRIWLIVALVALLGLGMLAALVGGVLFVARRIGPTPAPTSAAGGGLARLPTAAARPTAAPRPTAATRPTTAPRPTAAAGVGDGKILIEDDFDDPAHSSLTADRTENATFSFADGSYTISLHAPKYIVWSPLDDSYGDAAVEVDTTFDGGPEESAVGLLFHYQDKNNFYFFSIAGDGTYSLDLYKDDVRQTLIDWTDSPAIKGQGQTNRLRVETVGDRIRMFVNGKLLDEVSDDTFSKGTIALAVNTFSEGDATFLFDNLIVRDR